jgi:hypothetical protein
MSYKIIPIPGEHTMREGCPQVTISGGGDSHVCLSIRYHASCVGEPYLIGEVEFPGVYEFRFIDADFRYERHAEHLYDSRFALIEVENSAYVEEMAAKRDLGYRTENRFGDLIPESSVKHYRMVFDEYGQYDVIAREVIVRAITDKAKI